MSRASQSRIADISVLSCQNSWRNYYFVKITTEGGTVGWSEFDENFGSPAVSAVIDEIAHRIVGKSVFHHEFIREDLKNVTRPGAGGVVGQALGALENALLDAKARILEVPCYDLLGGKLRDELRVYWSHFVTYRVRGDYYPPGVSTREDVLKLCAEVGENGFTGVKTNIHHYDENGKIAYWAPGFGRSGDFGRNPEKALRRGLREHLELIRQGVGPETDILLDLNFNTRTEGTLAILRELADLDLFWVELDTIAPEALAHVRARSPFPIASCETLIGLHEFLPYFRSQAVDVAIIDTPWNGVWQSLKIAAAAEAHDVNVACHNFYGHLCTMMNAHFCAAIPNLRIMEVDIDRIASDAELFTHLPEYRDGHLVLPDRPGWGTEPDEAALARFPPLEKAGMWHSTPPVQLGS